MRGILVDTDCIALNQAKEYSEQLNDLECDLLQMQDNPLPIQKGSVIIAPDDINTKTIKISVETFA